MAKCSEVIATIDIRTYKLIVNAKVKLFYAGGRQMENRLRALFDYQRFEKNSSLQTMIEETHKRVRSAALSDEMMSRVSAAGEWQSVYETIKDDNN